MFVETHKYPWKIPFIYPSFYDKGTPPLQHLKILLKKRTPSHRKGFYTWLLVSPLTAPFMIIRAYIPDWYSIYCSNGRLQLWSLICHFSSACGGPGTTIEVSYLSVNSLSLLILVTTAFKASSYLESLLENGALIPEPNKGLDLIYEHNPPALASQDKTGESNSNSAALKEGEERIVLSREAVPKIIAAFELPASAEADLYRALDQTEIRLKKART